MRRTKRRCGGSILSALFLAGCGNPGGAVGPAPGRRAADRAPAAPFSIRRCRLNVALDPRLHRLEATADLSLRLDAQATTSAAPLLRLQLNRDLGIDAITCGGVAIDFRRLPAEPRASEATSAPAEGETPPSLYELTPPVGPGGEIDLSLHYGGVLFQDVSAGEKPGEIHNFAMRAHVDTGGVYLSPEGNWYPRLAGEDDDDAPAHETRLTDFELTVARVAGLVFVACGNRRRARLDAPRGETTTWTTPFPIDGMALVGGPHEVFQRQVGPVLVSVHLRKDHAGRAGGLLDAVESYLNLYQPLIGPYPYDEFTVVENFFSSGFAFPGFTVLASAVIAMGEMGLRPGYLDHEMLHNWWGNGVFVSALDGNWCECLTSYCANYMRPVLEGRADKARNQRRDICYGLSRITPEKDKPLGRFGRKDGPSRFVGYQKGSMVFAMLAGRIGVDRLWDALKRLRYERLGKPTTWEDIRRIVEAQSGRSLEQFFKMWVRGAGVPEIRLDDALYDPQARRLTLTTSQAGGRIFDVDLPVRLVFRDGLVDDEVLTVNRAVQPHVIPCARIPVHIEVDPDFAVMRKIPLDHIMPTLSGIGKSRPLVIVRAANDCEPAGDEDRATYDAAAEAVRRRYEDAEEGRVREIAAADLTADDLAKGHALILGRACLSPAAAALEGTMLRVTEDGFRVGETRYDKPGQAVLCCIRNRRDPGGVICFYYGNSKAALKKAGLLPFYGGNSLIVFEDGRPGRREDFERPQRVDVWVGQSPTAGQ